MNKILVIRLYFPVDALHVSDCISPSPGATGCCVVIGRTQQPDVPAYTKCDVQLINLLLKMD